ncbi:hypothetical protein Btru_044862 [Bulinus truncatus]|nr:hypothetical protein Btru_044862 [Bulinus truncatus]
MRNSPWIQQPRSESAPPIQYLRDPPAISKKEQDEITERVSKPTESALYRKSLCWKLDSFMDRGYHSWTKLNLFKDWKNCMWTPVGSIKTTYKLRPHKLPVLNISHCEENGTTSIETPKLDQVSKKHLTVRLATDHPASTCGLGRARREDNSTVSKSVNKYATKVCSNQKPDRLNTRGRPGTFPEPHEYSGSTIKKKTTHVCVILLSGYGKGPQHTGVPGGLVMMSRRP